jgi:glutamate 5-kinase
VSTDDVNNDMALRGALSSRRRWVVKIGSSLLTADGRGIDRVAIGGWCADIAELVGVGAELVLVSSGAVAEGCARLGLARRPETVHELQAAAAVGQMGLIEAYESAFQRHGRRTALVLLTHDDLAHRQRYLNARATLRTLLSLGVVPVVNENDSVATDEIKVGDNDTLASLVTNLIEADVLVLLTDRDGLHEADPASTPLAPIVSFARAGDTRLDAMVGGSAGRLGRGGMATKLNAARVAARSGATTIIANGRAPNVLRRIRAGERLGTMLASDLEPLVARKRWIAGQLRTKGELVLDAGAVKVLRNQGRSLLPVGVTACTGDYARGDVVLCVGPDGGAVAKGLTNYSSDETRKIIGCSSAQIAARLGYVDEPELVHRDNLVLL